MTPLVGWAATLLFGAIFVYGVLWMFSAKFRDYVYRTSEAGLRNSATLRVVTRCRALIPVFSPIVFAMAIVMVIATDGYATPLSDAARGYAYGLAIPFLIVLAMGVLVLGSYLFNWPKFFVPKEYRADKGIFGSRASDIREAGVLCEAARRAIESAPAKRRRQR